MRISRATQKRLVHSTNRNRTNTSNPSLIAAHLSPSSRDFLISRFALVSFIWFYFPRVEEFNIARVDIDHLGWIALQESKRLWHVHGPESIQCKRFKQAEGHRGSDQSPQYTSSPISISPTLWQKWELVCSGLIVGFLRKTIFHAWSGRARCERCTWILSSRKSSSFGRIEGPCALSLLSENGFTLQELRT
jgi:hypothetical protein